MALFGASLCANAQIATENSNALDNIGIGVMGGVSTPLDFNSVFPLNPNVGIMFTKDFTPTVGVQLEGVGFLNDNHFADVKTRLKGTNVGLNGVLNLTNLFCDYKGSPRTFEVGLVGGVGWLHIWTTSKNYLTAKTAFDLSLNIGKEKAWSVVLTPSIYWNLSRTRDVQFDKRYAQLGLNIGLRYKFKTSNGTHNFKTYDIGAMNNEINYLRGKLDECEAREPKVVEKRVFVEKPVKVATDAVNTTTNVKQNMWVVEFALNSAELTNDAKTVLNTIGQNGVVDVFGYASPDGSEDYNKKLSQRRADAVAEYLKARGLKVNNAIGEGEKLNRIVVVKPIE